MNRIAILEAAALGAAKLLVRKIAFFYKKTALLREGRETTRVFGL